MQIEDYALMAESEINAFEREGATYAKFALREMELEAARPAVKQLSVARLMDTENALASVPGKKHSASSAEAIVETDPSYAEHIAKQRETVFEKNQAWTRTQAARLRAQSAIACIKGLAGVA